MKETDELKFDMAAKRHKKHKKIIGVTNFNELKRMKIVIQTFYEITKFKKV